MLTCRPLRQGVTGDTGRTHSKFRDHVYTRTVRSVFSTSVGTKLLIGLTGVLLFLYLLIHIAGN